MNHFSPHKSFGNREAIVATHIDREHLHNHIVICAYDLDNGRKLHYTKFFLADLRRASDEICRAHGLKVLREYDPNVKSQRMKPKEYRAAQNEATAAAIRKISEEASEQVGKASKKASKVISEEAYGTTHCGGFAWRTRQFR